MDYRIWGTRELIERIHALEAQQLTKRQREALEILATFADDHASNVYDDENDEHAEANMKYTHDAADVVREMLKN